METLKMGLWEIKSCIKMLFLFFFVSFINNPTKKFPVRNDRKILLKIKKNPLSGSYFLLCRRCC